MYKRHKNYKKIVFIVFFLLIVSISVAYSILKEEIKIEGKSSISLNQEENKDYIVTYTIDARWNSNGRYYYKIIVNILNNTKETLNGWKVTMKAPENAKLENYSNTSAILTNNILQFENVSYNSQILSKKSVNFEFQISTTDFNYTPSDITINDSNVNIPENPDKPEEVIRTAQITLKREGSWKSDKYTFYQYTITILNTGNANINFWKFDLIFNEEIIIDQIWNSEYIINGKTVTFNNSVYNGNIPQTGKVSFGLILKTSQEITEDLQATNIILN